LLVFVAAERRELEGLLVHVDQVAKLPGPLDFARQGVLNGVQVVMVANGPGANLARAAVDAVKERENPDNRMTALISTGFCGGLQPSLRAGDVFVATEVVDVAAALVPVSQKPFKTGKLLSIDHVVCTTVEKVELGRAGADAVEMEAAAVALCAQRYNVPFFAVRVVTDTVHQSFPLNFNQMRSRDGRFSRAKILAAAIRRPGTIFPELIKLNKTTKRAAQALGDFLADARF